MTTQVFDAKKVHKMLTLFIFGAFIRSKHANTLPTFLGIFLLARGVNTGIMHLLHSLGIVVSRDTVRRHINIYSDN